MVRRYHKWCFNVSGRSKVVPAVPAQSTEGVFTIDSVDTRMSSVSTLDIAVS